MKVVVQALATLMLVAAAPVWPAAPKPLSFALVGDLPYSAEEARQFERVIDDINADASVRVVLHVGDIKGGGERCTDALLRERHAQLLRLRPPLAYTPGDNDWTDCHRRSNGGYNPLERLAFLRRLFYADPTRLTGGDGTVLARTPQSADPRWAEFVEHGWFTAGGLVFATLNVVGSNNDLAPWSGLPDEDSARQPRPDRLAEFERRRDAVLAWLDTVFDVARRQQAAGVVLVMQANPQFWRHRGDRDRLGFEAFIAALQVHAHAYERPVLLVHGDEHTFQRDTPLAAPAQGRPGAPNLVRVQTFGSPRVRWLRVTVEPTIDPKRGQDAAGFFRIEPMPGHTIAEGCVGARCADPR